MSERDFTQSCKAGLEQKKCKPVGTTVTFELAPQERSKSVSLLFRIQVRKRNLHYESSNFSEISLNFFSEISLNLLARYLGVIVGTKKEICRLLSENHASF